jgi:HEPN domain-containing protein/predicted nucleotidyltransferase
MSDVEILSGPPRFAVEDVRRVVARACRREGARRAILFGSYARGDADAYSDVDLLIVCETPRPWLERHRVFADVLDAFPGSDLLIYTPAELEEVRARSGFIDRVERAGVVLYGASDVAVRRPHWIGDECWIALAADDLAFAEHGVELGFFAQTCFLAQQVAEKAARAVHYARGARIVMGHSVDGLLESLAPDLPQVEALRDGAKELDQHYVPTRYPNGLPGNVPFRAFTRDQAQRAVGHARAILTFARSTVGS